MTTPTDAGRRTAVDAEPSAVMLNGHEASQLIADACGVDLDAVLTENANLRAQLATLPVIEQAKGVLIARYQISADAAFALLRRWSSHTNIKLREISRLLVQAAAASPPQGSAGSRPEHGSAELDRLINDLTTVSKRRQRQADQRP